MPFLLFQLPVVEHGSIEVMLRRPPQRTDPLRLHTLSLWSMGLDRRWTRDALLKTRECELQFFIRWRDWGSFRPLSFHFYFIFYYFFFYLHTNQNQSQVNASTHSEKKSLCDDVMFEFPWSLFALCSCSLLFQALSLTLLILLFCFFFGIYKDCLLLLSFYSVSLLCHKSLIVSCSFK